MKPGVILQERDFKILALVYERTVASNEFIKRQAFQAVNFQTAGNRLTRLCHAGFLRKYRAGLVIYHGHPRQIQMVFTITSQGIQALKSRHPERVLRSEPVPLNSQTLVHDLLLGEVVDRLKSENPGRRVINAKLLEHPPGRDVQVPDAVILGGDKGARDVAVELELTIKSERRYRELVANYRLQGRYDRVLFVHADDSLVSKIARAAGVDPPERGVSPARFSKFEFRKLEELIGDEGRCEGSAACA